MNAERALIGKVLAIGNGWEVAFAPDNETWITVPRDKVQRAPRVGDVILFTPPQVIGLEAL